MSALRGFRIIMLAAGAVGGLSGATYGLLSEQSRRARSVIGVLFDTPLNADGVYLPDGGGPRPQADGDTLTFAVLGDSSAAGLGAETADRLPGVQLARGLAEESGRPVELRTLAVSGATTRELVPQVDRAVADPPELALVVVGGNDVTSRLRVSTSARLLGEQVGRLRAAGSTVVVGTCPDLGAIRPIPQPLRSVASRWSLALARAQRREVERAGGIAVAMAELVTAEFVRRPTELFSPDRFHPNGAGYEVAASVLLAPLCAAAGVWNSRTLTGG